ncbi:pentapeptide repeat-containing protein [Streptomyces asiaticus]|uniref:pentapeptide repeat-containing protein n=1 Tax=Streptomyces asiaticus TaxID=114695 RepID=UPI003F66935C
MPGYTACLTHLTNAERTTYLTSLAPGADIDHRGTRFTSFLLDQLLEALRDPATGKPHVGEAQFDGAQFSDNAKFNGAQFNGRARFDEAHFSRTAEFSEAYFSDIAGFNRTRFGFHAWFGKAQFSGNAWFIGALFRYAGFSGAQFSSGVGFNRAQFGGDAGFKGAQFNERADFSAAQFSRKAEFMEAQFSSAGFHGTQFGGDAEFADAQFSDIVGFSTAQFSGFAGFPGARFSSGVLFDRVQFSGFAAFSGAEFSNVDFDGTRFGGDVLFRGVQFGETSVFGPVVCAGKVDLSSAAFAVPIILEIAAREVVCERIRWDSTATFRLRYAAVDLSHAVLSAPVAVTAHSAAFDSVYRGAELMDESLLTGPVAVRVLSVQGVDAAHLVLTDTDLSDCLFSGAFHLDQLRLEGRTTFARRPTGWHRHVIWPTRWTRRRTLAEEQHWRALTAPRPSLLTDDTPPPTQWRPGPHRPDRDLTPDPEGIAALYRQLRKAFEDGKNEPGAADFYYGECEMRRHDIGTPKSERGLLWGYWLLSGYGLRASRAAGWLLAAMTATVLLLMGLGLPTHTPDPTTTGTLHGTKISLNTSTADPSLHGGWSQRMTWARAEIASRVVINSVVFRSSGQNLTTAGTYIEMASRLVEPTLLALAVLAVRGRIKR